MPLIAGSPQDETADRPRGRIRNTRKLLVTAALIMSVLLLVSSFVTVLLIPREAYREGGPASGRAIAYMAHQYLGNVFGSVYDISTILVLWFAGASAMAGLLYLVPRYLPRVGLAPEWVAYTRPLVLLLFGFDVVVTLIFQGQRRRARRSLRHGRAGPDVFRRRRGGHLALEGTLLRAQRLLLGSGAGVRLYHVDQHPGTSGRHHHRELLHPVHPDRERRQPLLARHRAARRRIPFLGRRIGAALEDDRQQEREMVPVRSLDQHFRASRAAKVRKYYNVEGVLVFVHVTLLDNRSEFLSPLLISVRQEDGQFLVEASQAVATANAIAYLSQELHPAAIYLGLSRLNLMRQSFRYFLLGEGETGLMVYTILQHLWQTAHGVRRAPAPLPHERLIASRRQSIETKGCPVSRRSLQLRMETRRRPKHTCNPTARGRKKCGSWLSRLPYGTLYPGRHSRRRRSHRIPGAHQHFS